MSFSQGAVQHSTELILHGVCAVETAESVWSDGGVAGEAQEGGALGGTHLVNGSAVVLRAGGDLPRQGSRRRCSPPLLLAWGWVVCMGRHDERKQWPKGRK